MHCTSISCHVCGCLFQSSRTLSERDKFRSKKLYSREHYRNMEKVGLVLQMATYWFVIGWFDNQSAQKSEVRQAAKDVVKSEVYSQT